MAGGGYDSCSSSSASDASCSEASTCSALAVVVNISRKVMMVLLQRNGKHNAIQSSRDKAFYVKVTVNGLFSRHARTFISIRNIR
jgi:hypothetical protein